MEREGKDFLYLATPDEFQWIDRISFVKGNGAADADIHDPTRPRDWDFVMKHVVKPLVDGGHIAINKRFDDRKIRLDSFEIYSGGSAFPGPSGDMWNGLRLSVGPTWYKAFKADLDRSPQENGTLQGMGLKDFGNRWAYFSMTLGVAVGVVTQDGHVYIGQRASIGDTPGALNFVAGHTTFNEDVDKIDNIQDALREVMEETGILEDELVQLPKTKSSIKNLSPIGIAMHPLTSDGDFCFVTQANVGDDYFEKGLWEDRILAQGRKPEHENFIGLKTSDDLNVLINEGKLKQFGKQTFPMIYSSRLIAQYLRNNLF